MRPALLGLAAAVLALLVASGPAGSRAEEGGALTASVVASPLAVSLDLSSHEVRVGERLTATGRLANLGAASPLAVAVTLIAEPAGVSIAGSSLRSAIVRPLGTKAVRWRLCAAAAGNYIIVARAVAIDSSGRTYTAESEAELLTVVADGRACA